MIKQEAPMELLNFLIFLFYKQVAPSELNLITLYFSSKIIPLKSLAFPC